MAMVGVDCGSLAWSESRRPLCAVLHSSNEPGELSQWLFHDDSAIKTVVIIIIITMCITISVLSNMQITRISQCKQKLARLLFDSGFFLL